MRCQIQLRVCNASSKAKALMRNARRIGWKACKLEVQLEWVVGARATAGVAQWRDGVARSGEVGWAGAAIWHVLADVTCNERPKFGNHKIGQRANGRTPLRVEPSLSNEKPKFGNHKIGQRANGRTLLPAEPSHTYEMLLITRGQLIGGSKARAV